MNNSNILHRIRHAFSFSDEQMLTVFAEADEQVTSEQLSNWLEPDDNPAFEALNDVRLATFLNGLIIHNRGKREGPMPLAESQLNNNMILRKLKIALDFKNDDILRLVALAGSPLRRSELTPFFRKSGHKHYRPCPDDILHNLLEGLRIEQHGATEATE